MIITEMPWSMVMPGMVVRWRDVDRMVSHIIDTRSGCLAWLEGLEMPVPATPDQVAQVVTLGEADAVATLAAAGLNPEIIESSEQEQ